MKKFILPLIALPSLVFAQTTTQTIDPNKPQIPGYVPEETRDAQVAQVKENYEDQGQPRNLITVGTDGFGWSGTGSVFDFDSKSSRDEARTSSGSFSLNYNYIFPSRFMLGAVAQVDYDRTEIEEKNGDELETTERSTLFGITAGYNFNEDVYNSWWLKAGIGRQNEREEIEAKGSSPGSTDSESHFDIASLEFGKRFNFNIGGMRNISYSPSIQVFTAQAGGDAEDAGQEGSTHATLNILQFDVLW